MPTIADTDDNVTHLINKLPPVKWKCPHCGKMNRTGPAAEDLIEEFFFYMEHCTKCGYVHRWELKLTDDFKTKVLDMFRVEKK